MFEKKRKPKMRPKKKEILYNCVFCPRVNMNSKAYKKHIKRHNNIRITCEHCLEDFCDKDALTRHYKRKRCKPQFNFLVNNTKKILNELENKKKITVLSDIELPPIQFKRIISDPEQKVLIESPEIIQVKTSSSSEPSPEIDQNLARPIGQVKPNIRNTKQKNSSISPENIEDIDHFCIYCNNTFSDVGNLVNHLMLQHLTEQTYFDLTITHFEIAKSMQISMAGGRQGFIDKLLRENHLWEAQRSIIQAEMPSKVELATMSAQCMCGHTFEQMSWPRDDDTPPPQPRARPPEFITPTDLPDNIWFTPKRKWQKNKRPGARRRLFESDCFGVHSFSEPSRVNEWLQSIQFNPKYTRTMG